MHIIDMYIYMYVPIHGEMQAVQHCGLCSSLNPIKFSVYISPEFFTGPNLHTLS